MIVQSERSANVIKKSVLEQHVQKLTHIAKVLVQKYSKLKVYMISPPGVVENRVPPGV